MSTHSDDHEGLNSMPIQLVTVQLVAVEVAVQSSPGKTRTLVLQSLQSFGEPLRWAITGIDRDRQIAHVEAVVLQDVPFPVERVVSV